MINKIFDKLLAKSIEENNYLAKLILLVLVMLFGNLAYILDRGFRSYHNKGADFLAYLVLFSSDKHIYECLLFLFEWCSDLNASGAIIVYKRLLLCKHNNAFSKDLDKMLSSIYCDDISENQATVLLELKYRLNKLFFKNKSYKIALFKNLILGVKKCACVLLIAYDNESLVRLPSNPHNKVLNEICCGAFADNANLNEIIFPDGLRIIAYESFIRCINLRNIVFSKTLKKIDTLAFCFCKSLRSVKLNEGLKGIGSGAFSCCFELEEIYIPDSVTKIGKGILDYSKKAVIVCHKGSFADKYAKINGLSFKYI